VLCAKCGVFARACVGAFGSRAQELLSLGATVFVVSSWLSLPMYSRISSNLGAIAFETHGIGEFRDRTPKIGEAD